MAAERQAPAGQTASEDALGVQHRAAAPSAGIGSSAIWSRGRRRGRAEPRPYATARVALRVRLAWDSKCAGSCRSHSPAARGVQNLIGLLLNRVHLRRGALSRVPASLMTDTQL